MVSLLAKMENHKKTKKAECAESLWATMANVKTFENVGEIWSKCKDLVREVLDIYRTLRGESICFKHTRAILSLG